LCYTVGKFGLFTLNYAAFGLEPLNLVDNLDEMTKGLDMTLLSREQNEPKLATGIMLQDCTYAG